MRNTHIDNITMSLYISGYMHLKKSVIKKLQQHLSRCELCAERFEHQFQKAVSQEGVGTLIRPQMKSPFLQTLAEFLKLPPESPLNRKKYTNFFNQLSTILLERSLTERQRIKNRQLSLLSGGYMYTPPSTQEKKKPGGIKKPSMSRSQEDAFRMADRLRSLLEIFVDERIPIPDRAALAEEVLSFAKWRLQREYESESTTKRIKVQKTKKDDKH